LIGITDRIWRIEQLSGWFEWHLNRTGKRLELVRIEQPELRTWRLGTEERTVETVKKRHERQHYVYAMVGSAVYRSFCGVHWHRKIFDFTFSVEQIG
jgi:hypothetical protein